MHEDFPKQFFPAAVVFRFTSDGREACSISN